jgi:hypothetical protein
LALAALTAPGNPVGAREEAVAQDATQTPTDSPDAAADLGEAGAAGPLVELESPPASAMDGPRACSLRHRLCVQAAVGTRAAAVADALESADRAWDTMTGVLAVPAPQAPAGDRWRVYLVDSAPGGGVARATGRAALGAFDRVESFGLVERATPRGCPLDFAMARAIARGALWRASPATAAASAIAQSEALARLATACASTGSEEESALQSQPERGLTVPPSVSFDRGAALFFEWIDARFGSEPGALIAGMWALSPTRTRASVWREGHWAASPTGFDVLRTSLRDALWRGSTLDDVFVRFAMDRGEVTPPPAVAWHIPWPSHSRRLASPTPVSPTGASYVLIDHAGAPSGARLRIEAQWEDYARIRWMVAKLDARGHSIGELPIRTLDDRPGASMTVEGLDGTDRILVVAVNVGSTEHPFDPNQGEWEAHGWLLTVTAE